MNWFRNLPGRSYFLFSFTLASFLLLTACRSDRKSLITGTWKIDSVYTYYNGFGNMETNIIDLETYTYLPDGNVNVTWSGSTRSMRYQLTDRDSLRYFENNVEVSRYYLMDLEKDKMVLRKDKQPIFAGKNQQRFEVRYFSRDKSTGS